MVSSVLFGYLVSILPAGLLALVLLRALPRASVGARLAVHIVFFIFARDAMSPAGLWQLTPGSMRLSATAPVLLALAGMSGALFVGVAWLERVTWWRGVRDVRWGALTSSLLWGVLCAAVITGLAAALKGASKAAVGLPSPPAPDAAMLLGATLAHGLAIAALASGLY